MTQDYELPPLPLSELGGIGPDSQAAKAIRRYAHQAIELDRQQRGEPAAYQRRMRIANEHEWSEWGDCTAHQATEYARHGYKIGHWYFEVRAITAPQPAAPAQEVSDDEIVELRTKYDWRTPQGNIRFARDLLARYGNSHVAQPAASAEPVDKTLAAHTDLLTYVLQDDVHNRLTPRIIDIAYTAFMQAKRANDEDGGASDWFNDTKPVVTQAIAKLSKDLFDDRAPVAAQPSVPKYTSSIGHAGQAYLDSFKHAHPLPSQFRWADLWMDMCKAAARAQQTGEQHV